MHSSKRRRPAVAIAGLLGGVLLTGGAAGRPPAGHHAWLPELTASEAIDGPVVIEGRLVDRNGAGVPGRVTLVAWPTPALLGTLEVGDGVKLVPVGKAVAAQDGSFTVRIDPDVPMSEVVAPDGTVNFDLVAHDDSA